MDACVGVEREVVKVLDKFTNLRDQNVRSIDELLLIVKNAREELQNGKYCIVASFSSLILGIALNPSCWNWLLISKPVIRVPKTNFL